MTAVLSKILLFLAFGGSYYQRARDGQHVHEIYRNRHDVVIGGYQQARKHEAFTAQCVGQLPVVLLTYKAKDARRFVESCPDPVQPAAAPAHRSHSFTVDLGYVSEDGPITGFSK